MKTAKKKAVRRPPLGLEDVIRSIFSLNEKLRRDGSKGRVGFTMTFGPEEPANDPAPKARAARRFTNLDASGKPTTGKHVAVHDARTGLTWAAAPLDGGKDMNHADAMKACSALDLMGHKDWRAPTIEELLSIVDYERCDPAVDPAHFLGPYGWTWSATKAAAPAGCAWYVGLNDGHSDRDFTDSHDHVRAVRAGQF